MASKNTFVNFHLVKSTNWLTEWPSTRSYIASRSVLNTGKLVKLRVSGMILIPLDCQTQMLKTIRRRVDLTGWRSSNAPRISVSILYKWWQGRYTPWPRFWWIQNKPQSSDIIFHNKYLFRVLYFHMEVGRFSRLDLNFSSLRRIHSPGPDTLLLWWRSGVCRFCPGKSSRPLEARKQMPTVMQWRSERWASDIWFPPLPLRCQRCHHRWCWSCGGW